MKRLLAFLLLFPLLAGAFEAYFDYRNSALEPQGVKQVHLYPVYIYDTNGVLVTIDRIIRPTKADGTCTISNLLQGTYRAEFQGGYNVTTNWFQFPATNGLINAWLYRTNSAFGGIPTNGIFATLADLSNAVVKSVSGVASLNSSTGAVSIVGAGTVSVGTTSGVVTVTGTGGGGSGTATNAVRLAVGTNVFGILSNYVAGVYSQTTSLIIKGSTNTIANGVYAQVSTNYENDIAEATWSGPNGCGISYFEDGIDYFVHITNSAGSDLFNSGLIFSLPNFPSKLSLYAIGNGVDGSLGWTSNTIAEPYWELQGWQADTNFYAGDIHAKVIYGDLSGASNYQFTAVGGVQTSNLLSTVNINETLRHSFSAPVMGFISGELLGSTEATAIGRARYLYTNGLTAAGYNLVCLDAGWADRDANGIPILKTNLYPSGIASLINALATNDCKLGLYVSMWWPYGDLKINESTAYRDAYTLASWGIGWLKCDGGQEDAMPGGESAAKHIGELLAAGLDAGAADKGYPPVFLHYNVPTNRMDAVRFANGIYAAQPVEDATGAGDSVSSPASMAFQSMYVFVTNAPNTVGRGVWKCPLDVGNGTGYAYWDTNCTRVYVGLRCLEPWTLMLADGQLASTHASHIGIYTNREAIRINQDAAVGGAQWLSTNCCTITNAATQKARWRRMANGDIAVGLWNWNTNAPSLFTLNLTKLPFIQTNVAYVLRVFDNVGQMVTNSLDMVVNTNGYNLLRISRVRELAGDGSLLGNLNASALASGTVNNARLSGVALLDGTNVFTGTNTFSNIAGTIACAGTITTSSTLASSGGNVRGAEFQPYSASANTIISLRDNTKLIAFRNTGSNVVTITGSGDIAAQGSITVSNGSIVTSNSWVNVPTLANGQNFYCSSNGVPHVIWKNESGSLTTNRLVP